MWQYAHFDIYYENTVISGKSQIKEDEAIVNLNGTTRRKLSASAFQRLIFGEILDFFRLVGITETAGDDFQKREPTKLLEYYSIEELYNESLKQLEELIKTYHDLKFGDRLKELIGVFKDNSSNAFILLNSYLEFSAIKKEYLKESDDTGASKILLMADVKNVYIETNGDFLSESERLTEFLENSVEDKKFLTSIMDICKDVRNQARSFTANENSSVWFAYSLIGKGLTMDFAYRGLGTSGFRKDHHTLIFSTDPGDDHIRITSMNKDLIDGVAVHVEHIDRDMVTDKDKVEAYRLPAAINAAKVRLHISDDAPVTAFIGRPVFENGSNDIQKTGYVTHDNYEMDKLKSVHMTASACTTMFLNGVADCKVAVERMQSSDAIEFMKSVVGNVMRDTTEQTLAAAFNINTPFYDDKFSGKELKERFEIANLAIEVAVAGGFDRVTWDGADSVHVPSLPVIDQMDHKQFVELVHKAHENGLQTYYSAGLKAEHVERCVITGVDGLGIGTSLHYMDKVTHLMGAFDPKAIARVLKMRDKAEKTSLGKAAVLLAKLDRLYFEKTLHPEEDKLRLELYNALLEKDTKKAEALYKDKRAERVKAINSEGLNGVLGRAARHLDFFRSMAERNSGISDEEQSRIKEIHEMLMAKDLKGLEKVFAAV